MTESAIFRAAAQMPPQDRAAFLKDACAQEPALRREIESLLKAHDDSCSFLQKPNDPNAQPTDDYSSIVERPGATVGPYRLMEQIGEGGFGLVFVAEQTHPVRRKVALKIIKPGMDTREIIARFEAERQALALMEHPHIAKVLDAGATVSGRPFFVMELVKGVPITEYCDQQRLTTRERLELFQSVCHAVQHAHAKGIIHRDLKPSNILVAPHDGVPVVKVIDFGVAKAIGQQLTEKTIYTRFTQMIGTPLYMSPEQAEINALDIDIRSDIYSLGVLLYELLTGTTPFERTRFATAAYDEIRRIIKEEEPPKPSTRLSSLGNTLTKVSMQRRCEPTRLTALVKGDLDWIVMKALEKDRTRRYETANNFAADVKRFLQEEPIEARPPSPIYRLQKMVRRNKAAITTASLIALTLIFGAAISLAQAIRATHAERAAIEQTHQKEKALVAEANLRQVAEKAEKKAGQQRDAATRARDELRSALYASSMNLIPSAWETDNVSRVIEILESQHPRPGELDLRGFEWRYWDRLCHAQLRTNQFSEKPEVLTPTLSADAKRLFFWTYEQSSGKPIYDLRVIDVASLTELWKVEIPAEDRLAFLKDGQIAVSRDGERFAFTHRIGPADAGKSKTLVYDLTAKNVLFTVEGPYDRKTSLSPDGNHLALVSHEQSRYQAGPGGSQGRITLFDLSKPDPQPLLVASNRLGAAINNPPAFSPDGKRIAAIEVRDRMIHGLEFSIRIWNTQSGASEVDLSLSGEYALAAAFNHDGTRLATVGMKQPSLKSSELARTFVTHWNASQPNQLKPVYSIDLAHAIPSEPHCHLAFSLDGRMLAISNEVQSCAIFDALLGVRTDSIKSTTPILSASFSPDGRTLTTLRRLPGNSPNSPPSNPPGKSTTGPFGGLLEQWKIPAPAPSDLGPLHTAAGRIGVWNTRRDRQATYRPGQRFLLPGQEQPQDFSIILQDANDQQRLTFDRFSEPVESVAFSPDGTWVLSFSAQEAMIFSSTTGEIGWQRKAAKRNRFGQSLQIGEFSADGKWLALQEEGQIRIVNAADLKEKLNLGPAKSAKISLDSHSVMSFHPLGADANGRATHGEIKVWRLDDSQLLHTTPWENPYVRSMVFSIDHRIGAVAGGDNVSIQDLATGKQIKNLKVGFDLEKVIFSPTGSHFMVISRDPRSMWRGALPTTPATVVWDAKTLKPLYELKGHSAPPLHAVFSPDGKRIATASNSGDGRPTECKLWDAETGRELLSQTSPIPLTALRSGEVHFTPDGNQLVLTSHLEQQRGLEGKLLIWNATPHEAPQKQPSP